MRLVVCGFPSVSSRYQSDRERGRGRGGARGACHLAGAPDSLTCAQVLTSSGRPWGSLLRRSFPFRSKPGQLFFSYSRPSRGEEGGAARRQRGQKDGLRTPPLLQHEVLPGAEGMGWLPL